MHVRADDMPVCELELVGVDIIGTALHRALLKQPGATSRLPPTQRLDLDQLDTTDWPGTLAHYC